MYLHAFTHASLSIRSFALCLLLLGYVAVTKAQTPASPFIIGQGEVYSSALQRYYEEITPRVEDKLAKVRYTIPMEIPQDTTYALVGLRSNYLSQDGVRAPYEGATETAGELLAMGVANFKHRGRLSGYVSVGLGYQGAIGYSAIRQPEYYLPYLVADTSGGDYRYEHYIAGALYALRRGASELGAGLHFAGEIAYKYEDPRVYNTTGTLQATLGYKHHFSSLDLSATLHALYHRKYMNLWLWRPSQQDKFPLTYGFGMVDVQNTKIFFGTSRMHYMGGVALDLLLRSRQRELGAPHYTLLLSDQLYKMRTEESSAAGLFGLLNNNVRLLSSVGWGRCTLALESSILHRLGTEYIYATHQPDQEHLTITDLRQIGRRQTYRQADYNAQLRGRYQIPLSSRHQLALSLGGGYHYHQELYKGSSNHIDYSVVRPWAGCDYRYSDRLYTALSVAYRLPLSSTYVVERGYKDQLDYQLAYLPLLSKLKSGLELRWHSQLSISLPRSQAMTISVDAFYAPSRLSTRRPLYEGRPTTTSGIFSHPELIGEQARSYGLFLSLTYHI